MIASSMSDVYEIVEPLLDVPLSSYYTDSACLPPRGTPVITRWERRTAVMTGDQRFVIGYLPARHDHITSVVPCEGTVTEIRGGSDPMVVVRVVPKG